MRKQVDYVFRQLRYSAVDPTASTGANSEWIRENYLSQGYEVLNSEVVKVDANDVFVGIHLAKYEDEQYEDEQYEDEQYEDEQVVTAKSK